MILADEQPEFGGSLLASTMDLGAAARGGLPRPWRNCGLSPDAQLLPRSTAFGYHDHNFVTILERRTGPFGPSRPTRWRKAPPRLSQRRRGQRLHRGPRQADRFWPTGALERPLVFANNDVPGVMLASALSAYVNRYAVAPGDRGCCSAPPTTTATAPRWTGGGLGAK